MTLTIRPPEKNECVILNQLILMALEELAFDFTQGKNKEQVLERLALLCNTSFTRFDRRYAYVADQEGQVVGAAYAYPGKDLYGLTLNTILALEAKGITYDDKVRAKLLHDKEAYEDEYYIDNLAVFERAQGQGVAKKLIGQMEKDAHLAGFEKISLLAEVNNHKAKILYCGLDYVKEGTFVVMDHTYDHMVKFLKERG